MGLDALLSKLETCRADTPDTPCNLSGVSGNPAPIGACTLDTPDTSEISEGKGIATVSRWWRLHFVESEPAEVASFPPATHAEILERHPEAIAAEPINQAAPEPERACSTCAYACRSGCCGEPVAAGLSDLPGVIRYHPDQGATCPAWLASLAGDLKAGIRAMAQRRDYSGDDLALALADARVDPDGWRKVVEADEQTGAIS